MTLAFGLEDDDRLKLFLNEAVRLPDRTARFDDRVEGAHRIVDRERGLDRRHLRALHAPGEERLQDTELRAEAVEDGCAREARRGCELVVGRPEVPTLSSPAKR
jgi:hypothetical protein